MSRAPITTANCPICGEPRRPREIIHGDLVSVLTHQWRRLLEIQQIQTDLMEELAQRRRG